MVKSLAKQLVVWIARILVFPAVCLSGFGRWQPAYIFFAQYFALAPGMIGSYLRLAYYHFTLEGVGPDCQIGFGSYFAHRHASMDAKVNIGSYCVLGQVSIGKGTFFAAGVQILSGKRQHVRESGGTLVDEGRIFRRVTIGADCWIGAGVIIASDVGARVTLRPGCVIMDPVPDDCIMMGNPAIPYTRAAKTVN